MPSNNRTMILHYLREAIHTGPVTLHSGGKSDIFIDVVGAMMVSKCYARVRQELGEAIGKARADTVVGPDMGGHHLVAAALLGTNCKGAVLRRGVFTGKITPKDRVLVVDDVATTGNSLRTTAEYVEACGATVVGLWVVVDRREERLDFQWPFEAFCTLEDLREVEISAQ